MLIKHLDNNFAFLRISGVVMMLSLFRFKGSSFIIVFNKHKKTLILDNVIWLFIFCVAVELTPNQGPRSLVTDLLRATHAYLSKTKR